MKRFNYNLPLVIFLLTVAGRLNSQSFNLQQLLLDKKLECFGTYTALNEKGNTAVSGAGIAWLKGVEFSNGTIEVDIRGKDVLQQNFPGIAFHGVDTTRFDKVYFRPFNFHATDSVRRIHAVQYVSEPEYPWSRLREERNGIYEKAIIPAPKATDWFHATIVVKDDDIKVYVNHSSTPSLTVKKLNSRRSGMIGLMNLMTGGVTADFANLVIKKD